MKYERLTKKFKKDNGKETPKCFANNIFASRCDIDCEECWISKINHRLCEIEDKIESGELCDREEVKRETAKEILLLLGKGFDETARKDFKDLQWYKQFCRELELRYGIELFGKTEQVGNSDKLEDEE